MSRKQLSLLDNAEEPPALTYVRRRLLDTAGDMLTSEPDELAFQHSLLCQTCLPASKPKAEVLVWQRRQGRATLLVEAGKVLNPHSNDFIQLGLPYGTKARLLLMHLNSEAVRSQSPVIPVEASMTAFFRRLMGKSMDGRQVRMLKSQLSALAAATFRMGVADGSGAKQLNSTVVGAFDLWSLTEGGHRVLWPTTLKLSHEYFESLSRYAVPLDERAVAALAHSATALDVYCWLAQRLHRIPVEKPQFVPWTGLFEQFGQGYSVLRQFRAFFLTQLRQVQVAYSDARISVDGRGMTLEHSAPPIVRRFKALRAIGDASEG
jgi:hypothetical protein